MRYTLGSKLEAPGPLPANALQPTPVRSVDDAAFKKLFSHPRMIELLIRRHVRLWHGRIDYSTLERLPAELIDEQLPTLRRVVQECNDEDFDQFVARGVKAMLRSKGFDSDRMEEASTMATVETEFRRGWDAVRQQGLEQGIGLGQVRILRHLAARKFGRATAEELARLLAPAPDEERIGRVAAAIVDCEAADDFLASVRRHV